MLNLLNMNIIKLVGVLELFTSMIYSVGGVRRREVMVPTLDSHLPGMKSLLHHL